jgi:hypothetical protein
MNALARNKQRHIWTRGNHTYIYCITVSFTYKVFFSIYLKWHCKEMYLPILGVFSFRGKRLLHVTLSARRRIIQIAASYAIHFMVNTIADVPIRCPVIRWCLCDEDRAACFKIQPCRTSLVGDVCGKIKDTFPLTKVSSLWEKKR